MKAKNFTGYSTTLASNYIDESKKLIWVSNDSITKYEYKNNERTDKIKGYQYWLLQEGLPPFCITLTEKIKGNIDFLAVVKVTGLEACEVKNKVYFKATRIELM